MNVPLPDASLPAGHVPINQARCRAAFSIPNLSSIVSSFLVQPFAVLAVAAAAVFVPAAARAEGDASSLPSVSSLDEVRAGSLLLRDGERYVEAPRVATDIDIVVSGPTSRARVTQIFGNPTKNWVEAVYVNPLPDGGAVDTLKMVIGDRFVAGDIRERGEAKAIYDEARRTGRKATLFEQERPNIFTSSVANIGPGERVVVQIEYQEPVHRSGNTSSLRVPLVVAPRYNPAPVVQTVDFNDGRGWGHTTDPVPDRDRIAPPVLDPRREPSTNPVAITVHLNAGFPLGDVRSEHHAVNIEKPAPDARIIRLDGKVTPADRDFELTWTPAAATAPAVGLFREHVGDADYVLALVTPPVLPDAQRQALPREIVFVIDNSGSMSGTSIMQAKASLLFALERLKPQDRFNVIRFDHTMDAVFRDTVTANAENIGRAKAFVSAIQASGGTEMVPPMKAALTDRRGDGLQYLRQVVFLTDGEIGNEQELFETIAAMRGRSRVFMVGIGSAPNSFLMTRASEIGRGAYTHIGSVDQVQERMRELIEKLESPAVTGLTASWSGGAMDATPSPLPDLYRGEPVVIAARLGAPDGTLEIKGLIGDRPWSVSLPVARAAEGAGLSQLWARRKITDAEMARRHDRSAAAEADRRILALALEHHLVSRLTSLVAVDATPSRPEGARLTRAELPLNLPAGWDFDKVFGGEHGVHDKRAEIEHPPVLPLQQRADGDDGLVATRVRPPGMVSSVAYPAMPAPSAGFVAGAARSGATAPASDATQLFRFGGGSRFGDEPGVYHALTEAAPAADAAKPARRAADMIQRGADPVAVAMMMKKRGDELMAKGDAAAARQMYRRVAESGIINSPVIPGNTALAPDELPAFHEKIVTFLETGAEGAESVWTSPRGTSVRFKPAAMADRTVEAVVRRSPRIDVLPQYEVIGAAYTARVETPLYAGASTGKPEVERLRPGDKVFVLGRVEGDHNWLIVGLNDRAIGYVPADRVQKEPDGLAAVLQASDLRRPADPATDWTVDNVSVVTFCRSVSYVIHDANGSHAAHALSACKRAQGGWMPAVDSALDAPSTGGAPPVRRGGER